MLNNSLIAARHNLEAVQSDLKKTARDKNNKRAFREKLSQMRKHIFYFQEYADYKKE